MNETELVKQCLWCFKVHGFNVLEPGKVTPAFITQLSQGVVWRANTGAFRVGRRYIRLGIAGQPDILGFDRRGRFLGCECKVGKNKLSPEQRSFKHWLHQAGGIFLTTYSYEDLDISLKHLKLNDPDLNRPASGKSYTPSL